MGGHLILDPETRDAIANSFPDARSFIKRYMGSSDFIKDEERYCLWIEPRDAAVAMEVPLLKPLFSRVADFRLGRNDKATRDFAEKPWQFKQPAYKPTESIIVPSTSSERRDYIPIGYLAPDTVASNAAYVIYDAEPWVFALVTSKIHMVWTKAVGGQLETRLRYSNTIVYNNFPVPPLSDAMKEKLTVAALRVLDVREYHCERTLAELYDPDKMPDDLRAAHAEVDALVDAVYSKRGYETDEERLADLFAMYEAMTAEEAAKLAKRSTK